MYCVINMYGKELCRMATYERAEMWLLHYEDMYGLTNLTIKKI